MADGLEPDEQRRASREAWEDAAQGWAQRHDAFDAALRPVSQWLVDAIRPQPGHVVLELAAGVGETGFLAAELIQPGGRLISTDGAEAMVAAATARAQELGIGNVEHKAMELEWIDLGAAEVDAVLCRFGYMLAVDPEAALRETRRVLRPGGRVALAVWDRPDRNPGLGLGRHLAALGHVPPSEPGAPGPFALADADALVELVAGAGLMEPELERVAITIRAPSLDALWEQTRDMSPSARKVVPTLTPAEHYALREAVDAAWTPYVQDDGSVALPGSVLCLAAEG